MIPQVETLEGRIAPAPVVLTLGIEPVSLTPWEQADVRLAMHVWNQVDPGEVRLVEVPPSRLHRAAVQVQGVLPADNNGALGFELGFAAAGGAVINMTVPAPDYWYTRALGTNPWTVDPGQFDFFTLTLHEMGHALGLPHEPDPNGVMYGVSIYPGQRRMPTAWDAALLHLVYRGGHVHQIEAPSGELLAPVPAR